MLKRQQLKILAIGAHSDDIELGCGGTLARAIKMGHKVKMVIMSRPEYNNFDGKVMRTKKQGTEETKKAIQVLGVKDWVMLDFPIKNIPYGSETVEALDSIMCDFKPDHILTHWTFDTHQDHHNTSLATISAARNFNNILMYEPFPPSGRSYVAFRPQVYIDITDSIPTKIKSIKAHKSQLFKYGKHWIDSVSGRAAMRGNECGAKHAEVFELLRYKIEI